MKFITFLLGAVLALIGSIEGDPIRKENTIFIPVESRAGGGGYGGGGYGGGGYGGGGYGGGNIERGKSSCIIKGRSIEIDNVNYDEIQSRQATSPTGDDDYEDDEDLYEDGEEDYENVYPQYGPYGPPGYGPMPPYMQYGGGMRPSWQDFLDPTTALSVSSEPINDALNSDKEKYKYKRKGGSGGGGKKGGGNINCIIITRAGPKKIIKTTAPSKKEEPFKLFGFLPLTRRRRSIAHNLKALKSKL